MGDYLGTWSTVSYLLQSKMFLALNNPPRVGKPLKIKINQTILRMKKCKQNSLSYIFTQYFLGNQKKSF